MVKTPNQPNSRLFRTITAGKSVRTMIKLEQRIDVSHSGKLSELLSFHLPDSVICSIHDSGATFSTVNLNKWLDSSPTGTFVFARFLFSSGFRKQFSTVHILAVLLANRVFFCGAKLIFCCIRFHRFPKYFRCYIESTTQNVVGWIIKIYCWCKQFPCRIWSFFVLKLDHTLGVHCHCIQIANSLSHREKADSTRTLLKLHRWTALSFRKLI